MDVQLYKVEVFDGYFGGEGLSTYVVTGTPVNVNGSAMVQLPHGTIVAAKGFFSNRADALRAAADKVDDLRERLAAQADRLRTEALSHG